MANRTTPYGAILDTASSALTIDKRIQLALVTETGGSASALVTFEDSSGNDIFIVNVLSGGTEYIELDGLSIGTVQFTKTGTGTPTISLIQRSR